MSWLARYHSQTASPGECPAFSSFFFLPSLLIFFLLPWFLYVVSLLCFPLVAMTMTHSFYSRFGFLLFLHFLSSSTPNHFPQLQITKARLASSLKHQFNQTIWMKLLVKPFPVSQPGPFLICLFCRCNSRPRWYCKCIQHSQSIIKYSSRNPATACVLPRVPYNTAATESQAHCSDLHFPCFIFSHPDNNHCLRRQRRPLIFVLVFWLCNMEAPPEIL